MRHSAHRHSARGAICASLLSLCVLGCGLEGSPQPPSLYLPKPVSNLTASRAGDRVLLAWTAPRETTDKLRLSGAVRLKICRLQNKNGCAAVATVSAAPGKPETYTDVLPQALATGAIRPILYEVFGLNRDGRAAGPSNAAAVLAGQAPPRIESPTVTEIRQGVVLHWKPAQELAPATFIELRRTLLTPVTESHAAGNNVLAPQAEPMIQTLRITLDADGHDPGRALDRDVSFNRTYRYVLTRVATQRLDGQTLKLAGAPSAPVVIATRNTFPPSVPTGLAAVPVSAAINGGQAEVDLSWSANTDPDFAQYLVYRREVNANGTFSPARQIGPVDPAQPILTPEFRDLHVQPGHSYAYFVVAVDNAGNRSRPCVEVSVSVSTPP